jgi:hypothetical protein
LVLAIEVLYLTSGICVGSAGGPADAFGTPARGGGSRRGFRAAEWYGEVGERESAGEGSA